MREVRSGILSSDKVQIGSMSESSRVSEDKVTQGHDVESSGVGCAHSAVLHNPRSTHWNAASCCIAKSFSQKKAKRSACSRESTLAERAK